MLGVLCHRLSEEALAAKVELPSVVPIFMTVVAFLFVASICLFLNALRFSHRIAGPIYRVERTLQAVRDGDLTARANMRSTDFLGDIAIGLNGFLDWLEEHPPRREPVPGDGGGDAVATAGRQETEADTAR